MGAKEVLIPIFVVPFGLFVIYQIWQWHINHLLAIEALRITTLRDRDAAAAQAAARDAQNAAHEADIKAAREEVEEANEALEEVLAGAGGRGTRDRGAGSENPLPPV